jgi:hypothetical protein
MLRWRNPVLPPGAVVRIVRSHLAYPESIQDGALVYEGNAETFTDLAALAERSPQFYTAFVITADGLVSSGAIVRVAKDGATPERRTVTDRPLDPPEPTYQESGDPILLRASDIQIVQGNGVWRMDTPLTLTADSTTLIRIPVDAVAPNLKTIIVSLQNPTDQRQVSSYLLKRNQIGDAYEAVLAPVGVVGQARLTVEVFDYNQQTVRRVSTLVMFSADGTATIVPLTTSTIWWLAGLSTLLLFVVSSSWFFLAWRRRRKDEDNHKG